MTMATLTARPRRLFADPPAQLGQAGVRRPRHQRSDGDRLTLGQQLDSVWEGLGADGAAECPVCAAEMHAGSCGACGSRLF